MPNPDQVPRRVLERKLPHAPRLVERLRQRRAAFGRETERGELVIKLIGIGDAPVAAGLVGFRHEIVAGFEMNAELTPSEDLVTVVMITRLEAKRFVERPGTSNIGCRENGLRSFG